MSRFTALKDMRTIAALLGAAERTARRTGNEQPAAEHLLLAAIGLGDGAAARAMASLGIDERAVERAIVEEQAAGLIAAGIEAETAHRLAAGAPVLPDQAGVYRSSVSAQELFQAAGSLARRARQRLSSAHVVLAAADVKGGTLSRVLDRLGLDRAAMRAAAGAQLS